MGGSMGLVSDIQIDEVVIRRKTCVQFDINFFQERERGREGEREREQSK